MSELAVVERLTVSLPTSGDREVAVVDGMSLRVGEGDVVGLVGESGSGKTLTTLALARLLPAGARVEAEAIRLAGEDVLTASEARLRELRGRLIAYVLQEPSQALNPLRTVQFQATEAARIHLGMTRREARLEAVELLAEAGLEEPSRVARAYPHQLSGGQRQRVLLAAALSARPRLLVADEPTSALDPVSQRRLLDRLAVLTERRGMALLFVSHDLAAVAAITRTVVVAYAGETVEEGPRDEVLGTPAHPYTEALVSTVQRDRRAPGEPFPTIAGAPPRPGSWPSGCRFAPRCSVARQRCRVARPALVEESGRRVRCFLHHDAEERHG